MKGTCDTELGTSEMTHERLDSCILKLMTYCQTSVMLKMSCNMQHR